MAARRSRQDDILDEPGSWEERPEEAQEPEIQAQDPSPRTEDTEEHCPVSAGVGGTFRINKYGNRVRA